MCGSTLLAAPAALGPPLRSATFFSIEQRHREQSSGPSVVVAAEVEVVAEVVVAEVVEVEPAAVVLDNVKNEARPTCFVVSVLRRHA